MKTKSSPLPEDELLELAELADDDEPASSAGKLAEDELETTPVPPPPKPG